MGNKSSIYFWFLKVVHLYVIKKHHCDSQRIRSILIIGICRSPNEGKLHKCNTWVNTPYHRPCTRWHGYLLFLMTWYEFIYISNTWILWEGFKVEQLNPLFWWPPSFDPFTCLALISCVLVLMCIRYHIGVTWIFLMGWFVLYHMIGKYITRCPEFNNGVFLPCLV